MATVKVKKAQKGSSTKPDYSSLSSLWDPKYITSKDSSDFKKGFYKGKEDREKNNQKRKSEYITSEQLGYDQGYGKTKSSAETNKENLKGAVRSLVRRVNKYRSGGKVDKSKDGKWIQKATAAPMMKKGGKMTKKCRYGCK